MGDSDSWETLDDGDDCWETIDDEDDEYVQDDDSGQENEEVSAEPIQTFRCLQPGCPKIFSSRLKLIKHIILTTGEPRYKCRFCDRKFRLKDQLKKHLKVHRSKKQKSKPKKKKEAKTEADGSIPCMQPGCPERFSSKSDLVKHIITKAREPPSFKCPKCGCCFDPRDQLKDHLVECIRANYKA